MGLYIYGFGSTGKVVVDALLAKRLDVRAIIDKNKVGSKYRGIKVIDIETLKDLDLKNATCCVTIHNHYIDIREIVSSLQRLEFQKIRLMPSLSEIISDIELFNGYWLDYSFNYAEQSERASELTDLLADEISKKIALNILNYRMKGRIVDYPNPSIHDEYIPYDLPRYKGRLRFIDCGAHMGTVVKRLQQNSYVFDALAAFEPDLDNFRILCSKDFGISNSIFLPLAAWSTNEELRFDRSGSLSSCISTSGLSIVRGVSIDDTIPGFAPNLIKFDIEGAEIAAIHGLRKTIKLHKPNLCISLYHRPTHLFEIPRLIHDLDLGYKLYIRIHEHNTFGAILYCLQDNIIEV